MNADEYKKINFIINELSKDLQKGGAMTNEEILDRIKNGKLRPVNKYPGWYFDPFIMSNPPYSTIYYQVKIANEVVNNGKERFIQVKKIK